MFIEVYQDMIVNGQSKNGFGQALIGYQYDTGYMRTYLNDAGRPAVSILNGKQRQVKKADGTLLVNRSGEPVMIGEREEVLVNDLLLRGKQIAPQMIMNATLLRKDQWIVLDENIRQAVRSRLRCWADMRAANTRTIDGMGTPILEHERATDPGEATVDMDGLTQGAGFKTKFDLQGLPIPLTHCDFQLSQRSQATSLRGGGINLGALGIQTASRRVAETIEKTAIGVTAGVVYGDSTDYGATSQVYGLTTHPDRLTKTDMTAADGTNGGTVLTDWLTALNSLSTTNNSFGPFVVYTSTNQDQFLDGEFKTNIAGSLRNRLLEIEQVSAIRRLDYLTTDDTTIFVEMTGDTVEAINGMEVQAVQWTTMGGLQTNFKIMGIQVPNLRSDVDGKMGLLHATTA